MVRPSVKSRSGRNQVSPHLYYSTLPESELTTFSALFFILHINIFVITFQLLLQLVLFLNSAIITNWNSTSRVVKTSKTLLLKLNSPRCYLRTNYINYVLILRHFHLPWPIHYTKISSPIQTLNIVAIPLAWPFTCPNIK